MIGIRSRSPYLVLVAGVAFFAVLLLLVTGGARAEGDAEPPSLAARGSEVWSASMRVGVSRGLTGYSTVSERPVGALSADAFVWRNATYRVTNILYNRSRGDAEAWNVLIDFTPALPEGIECLALQLGDSWLNLADGRGNNRQFFWYGVDLDWRVGVAVPVRLREFPEAFEARAIDGWGNNANQPELGTADSTLLRRAGVSYEYGLTAAPPSDLPGARLLSNVLSAQSEPTLNSAQATDMVWQWGQFLDHDISLTPERAPTERLSILVPRGDPIFDPFRSGARTISFNRSEFDPITGTGPDNPRDQVNKITAFIDASNVYGSDARRTSALRTNDGTGRLRTSGSGRLLPYNADRLANDDGGSARRGLFFAGDVRANEHVGLTALHTLFVREHNRLAAAIASENRELTGHEIFELARKIVGAQMQAITYHEFLPLLLGTEALEPYDGYDSEVDPSISNEFSTAAYRFGHTMLSPSLLLVDRFGDEREVSLLEAFFNPSMLMEEGISGLLRGLVRQQAQAVDPLVVDEIRNLLFGPPGSPGRDLAALNIQRGRDHGLPDHNTTRSAYGLAPARTFADVSSDPDAQDALERAYGDVGDLDLWVGGLAEDHMPGSMIGETFRTIIAEQFQRLRDGDRYWFENDPYFLANPGLLQEVRATTLADVVRRNTPIGDEFPDNVFGGPAPAISLEAATSPIVEGSAAIFTLRRTGVTATALSVSVRIAETGATLSGAPALTSEVTFGRGERSTTLTLPTDDNASVDDESTVSATVAAAGGYEVGADANSAAIIVQDNDSEEIRLASGLSSFEWVGLDGISVGEALRGVGEDAGISGAVTAVYEWDEASGSWFAFFPGLGRVLRINTLTALRTGRTYWVYTTEPSSWRFASGAGGDSSDADDRDG